MGTNEIASGDDKQQRPKMRLYEFQGVVYTDEFRDMQSLLSYDEYRPDDIILATYPKSGTRWMQETLMAITQDGCTKGAGEHNLTRRFPFLEFTRDKGRTRRRPLAEVMADVEFPRHIKTHLPRGFFDNAFNNNAKFVIVIRNIKDVIVSYFHFYMAAKDFFPNCPDFNSFFEFFKNKKLLHGDWFDWVLGWWQERDNPNVHFVTYEAMKQDIVKETRRVAKFLGKEFTDEVIHKIVDSCSFDELKLKTVKDNHVVLMNPAFYRKGVVGDWVNYFTPEQNAYIDDLFKSKMAHVDLGFDL